MKRKKLIAFALTLTMLLTASLGMASSAFAIDYPSDIMNTKYQTAVVNLMSRGILSGSNDGKFYPDKVINRAEMAKIMAIAGNRTGELQKAAEQNIFSDLSGYEWAKGYINVCANAGIINGVGGKNFAPGKSVSYAELITMIIRQKNPSGGDAFPGEWPQNYISYAQMYNMMRDIQVSDWNAAVPRGEVAMLIFYNMPKGGSTSPTAYLTQDKTVTTTAKESVTFSVSATGSGTISYEWKVDGIIQTATSNSFTYVVPVIGEKHTITVTVTNMQVGKNPTTTVSTATIN